MTAHAPSYLLAINAYRKAALTTDNANARLQRHDYVRDGKVRETDDYYVAGLFAGEGCGWIEALPDHDLALVSVFWDTHNGGLTGRFCGVPIESVVRVAIVDFERQAAAGRQRRM